MHFGVELQNYVIADSSESKYSSYCVISIYNEKEKQDFSDRLIWLECKRGINSYEYSRFMCTMS